MTEMINISIIARIENDLREKFGVPRQSNLAKNIISKIVFEPEYRDSNAFRGLEEYSHIWLIWEFSENIKKERNVVQGKNWSPTVRPPRLGGNKRVGVFATRSPFRPNPIGLSSVKLERIELDTPEGPVLYVSGADLMNGTPIYDIKPYLPYVDCHPEATGSFSEEKKDYRLQVELSDAVREQLAKELSEDQIRGLIEILAMDPRPSYQDDPLRIYGIAYGGKNIRFKVENNLLEVVKVM